MQEEYILQIYHPFDSLVRDIIPLLGTEVRGVKMLECTAGLLFS